ncbi:DUF4179 domain-containing protein [Desulfotomaculum copahuensis]|uniref:DUF4179 domain-containing protein n=1 Tax=Desulfotomaculum copahuensis TaxID=1838280 RepID=A0A1B7LFE8_9FIRM|nr:DUF4179 domain-containing protein [Desulfotomaculum copahuensis]OAT82381.1 hypothetical protein A6M21_09585 [Desulfotomaculum copahuensis]
MSDIFREALMEDAARINVPQKTWEQVKQSYKFTSLNNAISNTPLQWDTIIRKICYGFAAALIVGGLLIASGFVSPVMAKTLERIPVIKAIFNFVGDKGLQNAIDKGFSTKVNRTATDKGISVTITDVLYDQGRLDIGYQVTTSRHDLSPNNYPGDMTIPLDSPGMQFFANNKPIHDTAQGTEQRMGNGRVGLVEIYPRGDLPETFNLQIAIHQIGKQQGQWLLTVPVSRQHTDTATKVFLPMKAETIGQTTIMIKKVEIAPSSTIIESVLTHPIKEKLSWTTIDDKGHVFRPISGYVMHKHVDGDMITETIRELFESPKIFPKYLILVPTTSNSGFPTKKIKVLLN